jgi:hypothetical protein
MPPILEPQKTHGKEQIVSFQPPARTLPQNPDLTNKMAFDIILVLKFAHPGGLFTKLNTK